jgi:hypothetical protein
LTKFPKCNTKIPLRDLNAKVKAFLNRQLGMKVYTKLVIIMELD